MMRFLGIGLLPPQKKIGGPKNSLFSTTLQLTGNFECEYLWHGTCRDNWEMALKTAEGPLRCLKIL